MLSRYGLGFLFVSVLIAWSRFSAAGPHHSVPHAPAAIPAAAPPVMPLWDVAIGEGYVRGRFVPVRMSIDDRLEETKVVHGRADH